MINAAVSGITATQVRDSIYLIDVVVRAQADERMSLETIRTLKDPAFERTVGAIERVGQGRVRTGFAADLAP